jgi:hypothetical protein
MRRALGVVLLLPSAWIVLVSLLSLQGLRLEPSPRDWPLLPVLLCTLWFVLRAPHDLSARSSDALLRIARTGGVSVVAAAELSALAEIARYAQPRSHALAAAGALVALAAALSLALRVHWLHRVRDGRVRGYRVRALEDGERVAGSFVPGFAYEPSDVLVRLCTTPGSYRGATFEVPVARVPRRLWMRSPWAWLLL